MRSGVRLAILATQVPIAAKMTTQPGWGGYIGWFLVAIIFGLLCLMAYDKLASPRT